MGTLCVWHGPTEGEGYTYNDCLVLRSRASTSCSPVLCKLFFSGDIGSTLLDVHKGIPVSISYESECCMFWHSSVLGALQKRRLAFRIERAVFAVPPRPHRTQRATQCGTRRATQRNCFRTGRVGCMRCPMWFWELWCHSTEFLSFSVKMAYQLPQTWDESEFISSVGANPSLYDISYPMYSNNESRRAICRTIGTQYGISDEYRMFCFIAEKYIFLSHARCLAASERGLSESPCCHCRCPQRGWENKGKTDFTQCALCGNNNCY